MSQPIKHTSTVTITSQTERLTEVREFIARMAREHGFSEDEVNKITIAVDEACTNIIKHGYKYATNGQITIDINRINKEFEIIISDSGRHFDPNTVSPPDMKEYLLHYRRGGLGVYLMKRIMDKIEFSFEQDKNQLRMVKYLT
jgi:serine/threonine-protein kinase RsbW